MGKKLHQQKQELENKLLMQRRAFLSEYKTFPCEISGLLFIKIKGWLNWIMNKLSVTRKSTLNILFFYGRNLTSNYKPILNNVQCDKICLSETWLAAEAQENSLL